ncbi:DNA repair photolyase [Opitutaceae bacterium TAV1]|nr:DNA repair photolyase [Opitutaceae bacterium TAV1]
MTVPARHACSAIPGRGSPLAPPNRFERLHLEPDPDADSCPEDEAPLPRTQFYDDSSESILNPVDSPDVPMSMGLNPYRGCEHGCAYCFARPTHDYLGWNAGLAFETRIMVKRRAPDLLRAALSASRWRPQVISMSGVTDCYQPAERRFRITRGCLEVLAEFRNPVTIITKNALITRDLDVLASLARHRCVMVYLSVTTLDATLAGKLEPRAARPEHRLRTIRALADAGVPVGVMAAPVIPGLTDTELPAILAAAADAGACTAGYTLLRLPYAVKDVFLQWLDDHVPEKKARILSRLESLRGDRLNSSAWGDRMRGQGVFAQQLRDLFHITARRAGLDGGGPELTTEHFRRPGGVQLELFPRESTGA